MTVWIISLIFYTQVFLDMPLICCSRFAYTGKNRNSQVIQRSFHSLVNLASDGRIDGSPREVAFVYPDWVLLAPSFELGLVRQTNTQAPN